MVHRKEEYTHSGHDLTIQQVNERVTPSAWINGKAAHEHAAIDNVSKEKLDGLNKSEDEWKAVKTIVEYMAENDLYFCKNCNEFYNYTNSSNTGFAGHQCGKCANEQATCPDNPNGDKHEDECLNPHQRNNARVPTKYKCIHCGRRRRTTPTG
jgi:uncharacterized protein CbrC (UPF0167 family)